MLIEGRLGGVKVGDRQNTRIMAIINLSPTSFYKGSIKTSEKEIRSQLEEIVRAKADFLDVGAISSAPSFLYDQTEIIPESTEKERLSLFFEIYQDLGLNIPISIDTQSAKIADYVLSKGATIINDISGFKSDPTLPSVISDYNASTVIMACKKTPGDVFDPPNIISELKTSLNMGISAGIEPKQIVVDPGLGGWVTQRKPIDDYLIIRDLRKFRILEQSLLVGISRKSFIGELLDAAPEKRLWGSLAATVIAILHGAHIVRTHDIKETKDACIITDFLKNLTKKETS